VLEHVAPLKQQLLSFNRITNLPGDEDDHRRSHQSFEALSGTMKYLHEFRRNGAMAQARDSCFHVAMLAGLGRVALI
jgi:hypothetical protein